MVAGSGVHKFSSKFANSGDSWYQLILFLPLKMGYIGIRWDNLPKINFKRVLWDNDEAMNSNEFGDIRDLLM